MYMLCEGDTIYHKCKFKTNDANWFFRNIKSGIDCNLDILMSSFCKYFQKTCDTLTITLHQKLKKL